MKFLKRDQISAYRDMQARGEGNIFVEVDAGKHAGKRGLFNAHSNPDASNQDKAYVDIIGPDASRFSSHPKDCRFYWI